MTTTLSDMKKEQNNQTSVFIRKNTITKYITLNQILLEKRRKKSTNISVNSPYNK